jgi:aldehyde:ferredoxin oxidoreductase
MKTIPGGYAGKILRVDLTTRATRVEPTGDPEVLHKFLGGTGLGTKILFDETWPELRPFDPENP